MGTNETAARRKRIGGILPLCVAMLAAFAAQGEWAKPALVAKVASGEIKEVRVSWWGWDAKESTGYLKAALESCAETIIVDRQEGPWITRPLRSIGMTNRRLVFEKGVELQARKGSFKGKGDSLLSFVAATNVAIVGNGAVLRMHRDDYQSTRYTPSEHRHCLGLRGAVKCTVENLTLTESGGDGIYVGPDWWGSPSRDVVIRGCICDRNHRQGISVTSADRLLIEDTVLSNTKGTAPAAGIDFEPNKPENSITRCVMRNCTVTGNFGIGIELYMGALDATSRPIDVLVENCRTSGNRTGFSYKCNRETNLVGGIVNVKGCTFERDRGNGIIVHTKPAGSAQIEFIDCRLIDCCTDMPNLPDISLVPTRLELTSGVNFSNTSVRQNADRPWINGMGGGWLRKGMDEITGDVTVTDVSGATRRIVLDDAWRRSVFMSQPPPPGLPLVRVPFDPATVRVVDSAPGEMLPVSAPNFRLQATWLVYAEKARHIGFDGRVLLYGKNPPAKTFTVLAMDGGKVTEAPSPKNEWTSFGFDAPKAGFYRMVFDLRRSHAVNIRSADAPLALELPEGRAQGLIKSTAPMWFAMPEGRPFVLMASGNDGEYAKIALRDPSGREVWRVDPVETWTGHACKSAAAGLWEIGTGRARCGAFDDFSIDLLATPGVIFVSKDRYWMSAGQVERFKKKGGMSWTKE